MKSNLVILIGAYGLIRKAIENYILQNSGFQLISSNLDNKPEKVITSNPKLLEEFYRDLLQKEALIDRYLLGKVEKNETIFIEGWYIESFQFLKGISPKLARILKSDYKNQFSKFDKIEKQVFYISCDIEKFSCKNLLIENQNSLENLSSILREWKVKIENVDGEAPLQNIEDRLSFLLTLKSQGNI